MKTRRFHITKAQGQVVRLALASLLDDIENIESKNKEPYYIWINETAKQLYNELSTYKWEV